MPTIRDQAVCIRRWDFSETSQTVVLFGREHGLIRGLAKGAKRERGRFSGGFELLTRGEVVAIVKPGRELNTLTDWDLQELFPALSRSLPANRAGLYFADLIQHMLTDLDAHSALFDRLVEALRRLGSRGSGFGVRGSENREGAGVRESLPHPLTPSPPRPLTPTHSIILEFQWTLLVETGYRPVLDRDARSDKPLPAKGPIAFSARAGGTVAANGEEGDWRVRPETIALLQTLAVEDRNPWCDDLNVADHATIDRANRLLAAYLRAIMDRETATMRALFGRLI